MINGYKIQLLLKQLNNERDMLQAEFERSLAKFDDEKKAAPEDVAMRYEVIENKIARLQAAQDTFNSTVNVSVNTRDWVESMSLATAIKAIGGYGRIERLWRKLIVKKETPRWARGSDEIVKREKDSEYAKSQVTTADIFKNVKRAQAKVAALREAIAKGNAEVKDLSTLSLSPDDVA